MISKWKYKGNKARPVKPTNRGALRERGERNLAAKVGGRLDRLKTSREKTSEDTDESA